MANALATIPPALKKIMPYMKRAEEVRGLDLEWVGLDGLGWDRMMLCVCRWYVCMRPLLA